MNDCKWYTFIYLFDTRDMIKFIKHNESDLMGCNFSRSCKKVSVDAHHS